MAFSKMTHLNYLWGVLPLGCVALGVWVGGGQEKPGYSGVSEKKRHTS